MKKMIIPLVGTLLLVGSFYDYQLSLYLMNRQSVFAIYLSAYGQLPALLCLSGGGFLLLFHVFKFKNRPILFSFLGIVAKLICFYMLAFDSASYISNMNVFLSVLIALTFMIIADVLLYMLAKKSESSKIMKMAAVMILLPALSLLIVNIIKIVWQRPRMRLLSEMNGIDFQSWWQIGAVDVSSFLSQGIPLEEFKSFPSAHTASAACSLILFVLPFLDDRLLKYQTPLLISAIVFTCLVALSRIIAGAHFLSDTAIGFAMTLAVMVFLQKSILRNKKTE